MLPFLFAALTMNAVGTSAQSIVIEVRRQFKEIKGLLQGTAKPDYRSCVDMCTKSAQKLMIAPALVAVIIPVLIGIVLGPDGVAGLLAGNTVTGFVLAIMMSNSGIDADGDIYYEDTGFLITDRDGNIVCREDQGSSYSLSQIDENFYVLYDWNSGKYIIRDYSGRELFSWIRPETYEFW